MSSPDGYLREIAELQDRLKQANKKWQDYEVDYILPCFKLAEDAGIDLRALVLQDRGNCVVLLVRELIDQRDAARRRLTRALPEHKVVTDFLREAFRGNDGAEGESVHMACEIIDRLSGRAVSEQLVTAVALFIDAGRRNAVPENLRDAANDILRLALKDLGAAAEAYVSPTHVVTMTTTPQEPK